MFMHYPYKVGKVQEEKNNTSAISNKLWARQEVQGAAEFQALVLLWGSVSRLWGDHQTYPIFRYSRWGYFSLARNSALPTWTSSFHDLLLTILSAVSTQTLHRTATGALIQRRSILRRGSGKKGGLFSHYCFRSSTSFAAPVYKRKKQRLVAADDQSWHKWPTQAIVWNFNQQ